MRLINLRFHTDPTTYFRRLGELPGAAWLDSGRPASTQGRYDIFTALPDCVLNPHNPCELTQMLDALSLQYPLPRSAPSLPFQGGWLGYFSYEFRHNYFRLSPPSVQFPAQAQWCYYSWALIQDHEAQQTTLLFRDHCPPATRERVLSALDGNAAEGSFCCSAFSANENREDYRAAIERIQQYILDGDCYQVNYAQRFEAEFSGSAASAYETLRKSVPSPFCAFLNLAPECHILSISPERFIAIDGRQATTHPIKGTIARHHNPDEDALHKQRLATSEKDLAENLMIVDLLRNDFSQNCVAHTVRVPRLFAVESFANVHHLVSTIEGTLQPDVEPLQFVLDCFPGGSITGAPKKRAMEIIAELEKQPRGIYCGSVGYVSDHGRCDFNIAIRTLLRQQSRLFCWGGGGIVADSQTDAEYQESWHKVTRLMDSLCGG